MPKLSGKVAVQTRAPRLGQMLLRQSVPLAVVCIAFWLLKDRFDTIQLADVAQSVAQVSLWQWAVAILFTGASFWAVGRYDAVIHGLLQTNVARKHAIHSGLTAIAVAQFAGFGVLTGALVRWRMLPDVSLWQATRISLVVSGSFLAGWAVVASIFQLAFGGAFDSLFLISELVLVSATLLAALSIYQPKWLPELPSLRVMSAILTLAMLDTLFAGTALWVLLPSGTDTHMAPFFAAFLLALGAGLLGGTPGGIGPFEMTLLIALPMTDDQALLGAALAFRMVYYALPAVVAGAFLLLGPIDTPQKRNVAINRAADQWRHSNMDQLLWRAKRAEVNLIRQNEFSVLSNHDDPLALVAKTGQSLIMLQDGLNLGAQSLLNALQSCAVSMGVTPVIYKCGGRTAAVARRAGWQVTPIAHECWIDPRQFSTDGSRYRQLRRMLRKATDANVTVTEARGPLPESEMANISREWANFRGGERGFSMGRYDPAYVRSQRVLMAKVAGNLVGFITLHEVENEWTLDLMRHSGAAPDGTMHILVATAIQTARAAGCPRLSLAAIALDTQLAKPPIGSVQCIVQKASGANGLQRFKNCFSPNLEPLYVAAPTKLGLVVGLWDIPRRINRTHRPRIRPGS